MHKEDIIYSLITQKGQEIQVEDNKKLLETIDNLSIPSEKVLAMVYEKGEEFDNRIPKEKYNVGTKFYFGYKLVLFCKKVLINALPELEDQINNQHIA
jgi:hypothetical protein